MRGSLLVLAGLSVVLVSALLVGGARSATQASGLIAFTRYDGIYVMRPDGSGVRALRRGGAAAHAYGLIWSRDGSKLAFANEAAIWVMNADGTGLVRVVASDAVHVGVMSPTWSPDGRRIAYTALQDGGRDIWVVDADGSNRTRLVTTPDRSVLEVAWSPVAERLAFTEDPYSPHLYAMNTDGSDVRALTPGSVRAVQPQWSPNGRRIAFVRLKGSDGPERSEIYITNLGGRSRVRLTQRNVFDQDPVWSSDGRRVAFVRGGIFCLACGAPKRANDIEIYVINADGTGLTRLTHNRLGEGSPAWQPGLLP